MLTELQTVTQKYKKIDATQKHLGSSLGIRRGL